MRTPLIMVWEKFKSTAAQKNTVYADTLNGAARRESTDIDR